MGPSIKALKPSRSNLFFKVRQRKTLRGAWQVIKENAIASTSEKTKQDVIEFERKLEVNLDSIQRQLQKNSFKFLPSRGIAIKKKGKSSKRPVVLAPVKNRLVQRAILDVVQDVQAISDQLKAGYNFGGVEGREFGVPKAILKAYRACCSHESPRVSWRPFRLS